MFDYLALGAIVDGAVFCVHGGLSPNLQGIDQVSFCWYSPFLPLLSVFLAAFDQLPLGIAITLISSISLIQSRLFLLLSLFLMGLAGCLVLNPA